MRGRHSAAILEMMGVTDTIAGTVDDYVSIAVRLATDPARRHALPAHRGQCAKVYRDRACITALEDFLEQTARSYDLKSVAGMPPAS